MAPATAGKAVSAAEANREFSKLLRGVRAGHSYVVTSHGRPVARIVPVAAAQQAVAGAREVLLARLRAARVRTIGTWSRDDLYDEP